MDSKVPINPPSHNKSYIHVISDAFSHFVVTVPIKSNNAKSAIKTLLHHWIIKFGPPIYLVSDRGSEYVNKEMVVHTHHTFVHLWEFFIPLEQLIFLGQMAFSKYKMETLVQTCECSFMTPLKLGIPSPYVRLCI